MVGVTTPGRVASGHGGQSGCASGTLPAPRSHSERAPDYTLFIPGPLPSLNDLIDAAKGKGGTGVGYSTLKHRWTEAVFWRAKAARLPALERIFVRFTWVEKDRSRNPDNIAAGGRKPSLDGLVQAKVIKNDGWKQVAGWIDAFVVGAPAGVRLEIYSEEAPCARSPARRR